MMKAPGFPGPMFRRGGLGAFLLLFVVRYGILKISGIVLEAKNGL